MRSSAVGVVSGSTVNANTGKEPCNTKTHEHAIYRKFFSRIFFFDIFTISFFFAQNMRVDHVIIASARLF